MAASGEVKQINNIWEKIMVVVHAVRQFLVNQQQYEALTRYNLGARYASFGADEKAESGLAM